MILSIFKSLPSYPGSKRKLLGSIFKHILPPGKAPRLIDAFCGGCSVSLYGKRRGYEIVSNDKSLRAFVVAKALIENSKISLSKEDALRLFVPNKNVGQFVQERFPHVFIDKHCAFLDQALSNIQPIEGTKRYLLLLLIFKFMLRARPMSNFGARRIIEQIQKNDWEEMNKNFLSKAYLDRVNGHPFRMVEEIRKQINRGVFSNGKANMVSQRDVFEFLPEVEGDTLYLDPPYQQTSSYESSLKVVDSILQGKESTAKKSVFSDKHSLEAVERLLDSAQHIPRWILSFGNQGGTQLEDLISLFKKFKRHVRGRALRYQHCPGLSSEEHKERNLEFLVVGHN